jgi:Flp pilus assembly protein TadG
MTLATTPPATPGPPTTGTTAGHLPAALRDTRGGGAVAVPTAILALVVAVLSGLTVDGVRAAQATASADAIAAEAARAGGQAIDTAALARGNPQIDPAAAVAAARSYLAAAHAEGTAVVDGRTITVSVTLTRPTVLLGLVGRTTITSHGVAQAQLVPVGAP